MRLFVKLMALVVVLALAGPFFLKGPDGRPLMKTDGIKATYRNVTNRIKNVFSGSSGDVNENGSQTKVHRWQDSSGQWHYSDEAPTSSEAEVIFVDPNANVIQSTPTTLPPQDEVASESGQTEVTRAKTDDDTSEMEVPSLLNPGSIKKTYDDAKGVQDLLDQRNQQMQQQSTDQ